MDAPTMLPATMSGTGYRAKALPVFFFISIFLPVLIFVS